MAGFHAGHFNLSGLRAPSDDRFQSRRCHQGVPPRPQGGYRQRHGGHPDPTRRTRRAARLFAQARAVENLRGFSALRRAAATDARTILGPAAARPQSRAQPDRNRQYAWNPAAEFRGDARRPREPRSVRPNALDLRPALAHPGSDREGPGGAGAGEKTRRRQARGAPQRTIGSRQPRHPARHAGQDRKRVLRYPPRPEEARTRRLEGRVRTGTSWFETREDALLTMREGPISR